MSVIHDYDEQVPVFLQDEHTESNEPEETTPQPSKSDSDCQK